MSIFNKDGWAVVDGDGINIRSVSPTRRAAIVNWLVVEAQCSISIMHTDDHIDALWDAKRGEASVTAVTVSSQ